MPDTLSGPEAGGLKLDFDRPPPSAVVAGARVVPLVSGVCWSDSGNFVNLEFSTEGPAGFRTVDTFGMPRPDRNEGRHGGFWTNLELAAGSGAGEIALDARATFADGSVEETRIAVIGVEPAAPETAGSSGDPASIAICMATYNPDPELFAVQIASIRDQTDTDWVCLISDDCSDASCRASIEELVGNDDRFVFSASPERLGFYRNFERALGLVPAGTELVVLSDQDDRWHPDKLDVLRGSIGTASLIYSDQRLVDRQGNVIGETFWAGRRNNHRNFRSMLIANTVTGAASMFPARLLDLVLPFPDPPGWQFHDQWIAAAAMATGDIAYVDRPLYDYVQHEGAILGQVTTNGSARSGLKARLRERVAEWRGFSVGWRAAYFYDYLRIQNQAAVILFRGGDRIRADRRKDLNWFLRADRYRLPAFRLFARSFRGLTGRTETLGVETQLTRGLLWKQVAGRRGRSGIDAGLPGVAPTDYGSQRLRRWRSGR